MNPDSQYKYFPAKEEWTWAKKQGYEEETVIRAGNTESVPSREPWARQSDGGWAGMRGARTLGDAVGDAEGWKTVRRSQAGTQGSGRPVQRVTGASQVASGSNITLSQIPIQPTSQNTRRSPSRNGSMVRGRQSRLGDYWQDRASGQDADDEELVTRQAAITPVDNLC